MSSDSQILHGDSQSEVADTAIPGTQCQVIPEGDEPPCLLRREGTAGRLLLCEDHYHEHQERYFAYKSVGHRVSRLRRRVLKRGYGRGEGAWGREKLEEMTAMREEYGAATADELDKRKSFGGRFYAHMDDGHAERLRILEDFQVKNNNALAGLRQRKHALVVAAAHGVGQVSEEETSRGRDDAEDEGEEQEQEAQEEARREREERSGEEHGHRAAREEVEWNGTPELDLEGRWHDPISRSMEGTRPLGVGGGIRGHSRATANRAPPVLSETRPLLSDAIRSSQSSSAHSQVPAESSGGQAYGSIVAQEAIPPQSDDVDIEQQGSAPAGPTEDTRLPEVFDICLVLILGLVVFYVLVKFVR